jgi:putative hydrolase of HD superfamily
MTSPNYPTSDAVCIARFAFELGVLKRLRRTGWSHAGIRDPETVADHSLRTSQLAAVIAAQEGADPVRAAFLAVWHDSQETRTGDIPHTARPYVGKPDPLAITESQVADLPGPAAKVIKEAVSEYEQNTTLEALCAHDADKLECLVQAVEYRATGNSSAQHWIDSSFSTLRTETARQIALAAIETSPMAWRETRASRT